MQNMRVSYFPTADPFNSECSAVIMAAVGDFVTAAWDALFKSCVTGIPGEAVKPMTVMGWLLKSCHEWWL